MTAPRLATASPKPVIASCLLLKLKEPGLCASPIERNLPDMGDRLARGSIRNKLIAGLAVKDFNRIRPHLKRITLPQHERLLRPGAPTEYAYFPETGMVSLILSLEEGHVVEVGLVGNEGIVGVLAGLGTSRISGEAIVQMAGSGLRIKTGVLRKEIGVNPSIRQMLLRYVQALFCQITQTAACNARHQLPQRLARWLLMANDCTLANEVNLNHEFLSMMLSVRRPGVTLALNELSDAGIIATGRGRISILNRKRLEATACECYRTVKAEYGRLLGRRLIASPRPRTRHRSRSN